MFSYDGDQLIDEDDPIIIDYQLVNYGHPAYDLVILVFKEWKIFWKLRK